MNLTEFLRGVSLFSGLTDDELKSVGERTEVVQFVRDAVICKEGQKADAMFIIKSGIVQISCDDGKGGRRILTHLKLGEYFGEMSILTEEPRTATAVALAETECIRIKKDDFHRIMKDACGVALGIIRTLCERLSHANVGTSTEKKYIVYAIMGPDTGSGKSFFARNLAWAMQKILGREVLLYDPNLRDEKVAKYLGVEQRSKIIDELVERERIADLKKYVAKSPCGLSTIIPQENGLTDLRLKEFHTFSIMKTVMDSFEFIVVDSSSMYTKVTKEIVQSVDKIVYLISSANVSVGGLIDHFEETRRTWKVDPTKVVYGVNDLTQDPSKKGIITDRDRTYIQFQIPFEKNLAGRREADQQVLVQREPDHPISRMITTQAEAILFDQVVGLLLPVFDKDPAKAQLSRRWADTAVQEFSSLLRQTAVKGPNPRPEGNCSLIQGRTAKWHLNQSMVKVVDFANRFKTEFGLQKITLLLNGQESQV